MKNYISSGEVIAVTAPYTLTSGLGCQVGGVFGVSVADYTSGAAAQIRTEGVFDIAKATGAVAYGDELYWDNTNKVVTTTQTANKRVGVAIAAALSADTTARVKLDQSNAPRIFKSSEQTGTGSAQNVAHGLGETPAFIIVYPSDLAPATTGSFTLTEGTHTSTNVVVTVTTSKKFFVVAFAG